MTAPIVSIKHRRYASAVERLGYLLGEKEKRGKSRPAIGPRVGRYWGSGFPLGGTVETDAAYLMLNALTMGRCECIEFLVSEEQIGRDGRTVETVVECLMKELSRVAGGSRCAIRTGPTRTLMCWCRMTTDAVAQFKLTGPLFKNCGGASRNGRGLRSRVGGRGRSANGNSPPAAMRRLWPKFGGVGWW